MRNEHKTVIKREELYEEIMLIPAIPLMAKSRPAVSPLLYNDELHSPALIDVNGLITFGLD